MIYQLSQPDADEFKAKNAHYHSLKHPDPKEGGDTCCQSFFSKIYVPPDHQSPIERCIAHLLSQSEFLVFSKPLLESLTATFFRIKEKGVKDKLPWDMENERYVLHEVLKEGVQSEVLKEVRSRLLREQKVDSKQPGLLATPSSWEKQFPGCPLEFLKAETLSNLSTKGYAVQKDFLLGIDMQRELFKELNYLSLEGKFDESIQEMQTRTDRSLWISLSEMQKKDFPMLFRLCNSLAGIPYELNKKNCGFFAQISEAFQVSYFPEKAFQNRHLDSSSIDNKDNGKQLTCLYFCSVDPDYARNFGKLRLYPKIKISSGSEEIVEEEQQEILMEWDSLLVLKSRKVAYEIIENTGGKKFVVRYWVNGPRDLVKGGF